MKRLAISLSLSLALVGSAATAYAKRGGGKAAPAAEENGAGGDNAAAEGGDKSAGKEAAPASESLDTTSAEGEPGKIDESLTETKKQGPTTTLSWQDIVVVPRKRFIKSGRLEIAPIAGAIAVARRSWGAAIFLSLWFWAIVIVKGASESASVENGSFFRFVMPAAPALIVLIAALPLLMPRAGVELARRWPAHSPRPVSRVTLAVAAVVLGLIPLVAAAAVSPLGPGGDRTIQVEQISVPVIGKLHLRAEVRDRRVLLRWQGGGSISARVFYRLYRADGPVDLTCKHVHAGAANECHEAGDVVLTTRAHEGTDRPAVGVWTYRLAVAANYLDDARLGDVFLVSRPVTVSVG